MSRYRAESLGYCICLNIIEVVSLETQLLLNASEVSTILLPSSWGVEKDRWLAVKVPRSLMTQRHERLFLGLAGGGHVLGSGPFWPFPAGELLSWQFSLAVHELPADRRDPTSDFHSAHRSH